jgi:hypothetical protein
MTSTADSVKMASDLAMEFCASRGSKNLVVLDAGLDRHYSNASKLVRQSKWVVRLKEERHLKMDGCDIICYVDISEKSVSIL